jgi:hypothetical protein
MFEVRRAEPGDEAGIREVCTAGGRVTDGDADEFFSEGRIAREIEEPEGWDGWYVALEDDDVIGESGYGRQVDVDAIDNDYGEPAANRSPNEFNRGL